MIPLKTLIFTIFIPGSVTVLFPYLILSSGLGRFEIGIGIFRFTGLFLLASGVLIYLWCAWGFTFIGRGTPLPIEPPKELVAEGLYRFVRNPMYVGVLLVIFGEAVYFASAALLLYAILIFTMFHSFTVFYEEPTLKKKFGEPYEKYCNTVPRWIPKLRAGK